MIKQTGIDGHSALDQTSREHGLDLSDNAPGLLRQGFVAEFASASAQGRGRARNEDASLCALPALAVADGVGGERAGHLASWLAVGALAGRVPADPYSELRAAFKEANSAIRSLAYDESFAGAVTTLTAVRFIPGGMWVGHLGDSRAYRIRAGAIDQLTGDHSVAADLCRLGVITEAEAERHPMRSTITKGLGLEAEPRPDLFRVELAPGDTVLLCTDGLSKTVAPDQIVGALSAPGALPPALDGLVGIARERGSDDVTIAAARIAAA